MARDGSGNFSLVAGNPVVTGTTITVTWANTTLADIATALTGSLARDGQAAATGPLNMGSNAITGATTIAASGAVIAASLIPTSATVPANGMYLSAANTVAFATNSTLRASIDTSGNLVITGSLTGVNAVLSGSITAVGATLTGTVLLGGVNVTDFSRLSQNNVFLSAIQTISAASPILRLNNTTNGATDQSIVAFRSGGVDFGYAGNGNLITGATRADISLRAEAGGLFFSGNAGTTAHFALSSAGILTTPNASASECGYKGLPQNSQAVDYTAVLADADKNLHQTGATKTFTIPSNASVAFPVGTVLNFSTDNATGCSIAITTDVLRLAGTATTGTRTLAQYGMATALKILSTTWLISGAGLS